MARPRHASTVVLARPDTSGGFEVLLTRRLPQMRFLGGYYVFPGGAVHEGDYAPGVLERCRGLSADEARIFLGGRHSAELAMGHWIAVIRELYEEVGIVLCVTEEGAEIDLRDPATKSRFESKRQDMVNEKLSLTDFLESEGLYCDLSRLIYFFHRVTPEFFPLRFDTRFYMASMPNWQTALERSEEVTHSVWVKPREALWHAEVADFPILPPTTTVLADLGLNESWDELRAKYCFP